MSSRRRYLVTVPETVRRVAGVSLEDILARMPAESVKRRGTSGVQVVELTPQEAAQLAHDHEGIIVEEDQDLELHFPMPGLGFRIEQAGGQDLRFEVRDAVDDEPIADVTIFVPAAQATYQGVTGSNGKATVHIYETAPAEAIVSPAANYWSQVVALTGGSDIVQASLTRLEPNGAAAWSRQWMDLDADFPFTGQDVKVAVIDSGIAEHADLQVTGGVNALDGEDPADFRRDEKGHGTHCAGVIAGRGHTAGVLGIAPDAEVYSVKVFPGGRLSDLIEGLQWALDNGMDIVSMSLGMRSPSQALAMKLAELAGAGVTLVAAAGNDGSGLSYPAADEGVLAVAAFGSSASFPENSAHRLRIGQLHNPQNGLFVANFSNRGPGLAFIAPGVAIVSSVPTGYAAWDGTSMACPFISGLAALVLGAHPELKTGDVRQPQAIAQLLSQGAVDLALPPDVQGAGVPQARRVLESALTRQQAVASLSASRQQQQDRLGPLIADIKQKREEIRQLLAQVE